jgi:hypothetical protein
MKKRPLTLVEVLETPRFQFWSLFVVASAFYFVLRFPRTDELPWLCGISFAATLGTLGVIRLTEHADNPFRKPSLWIKAFVSSLMGFGFLALIAPYAFFLFPAGLMLIPVIQAFALSLAVEEDFGRCFWWSFGGAGFVIGTLFLGVWLWSGAVPLLRIGR